MLGDAEIRGVWLLNDSKRPEEKLTEEDIKAPPPSMKGRILLAEKGSCSCCKYDTERVAGTFLFI